jgi:inhibitor of cysteine peptidase
MDKLILAVFIAGSLVCIGCAQQEETFTTDPNTITKEISVKVDETFNITLASNPTTGYSWRMGELKPGVVQSVSDEYKPAENTRGLVGAGGEEIWTFKAVGAGNARISFEYVRSWEVDVPPVKKADFNVTVTK